MTNSHPVHWLASATGNPPRTFTQDECFRMAGYESLAEPEARRRKALFRAAAVEKRALWLDQFSPTRDPNDFTRRYATGVRAIAPPVARQALARAGLTGADIDFLVFVSCTGYTCPGFSAELAYALGVPEDRPTANLLGMGCSALLPGLERAVDRLRAFPGSRALVISAEICSATYWIDDELETAVGNALFGDGAAAIVLSSVEEDARRALARGAADFSPVARIEGFRTLRDGRYLDDMGFVPRDGRLRVRLAREIPERVLPIAARLLDRLELPPETRIALHPGGRKILDLLGERLAAKPELAAAGERAIGWARGVLRDFGNMSSPSVAFVLERSFAERPPLAVDEPGALITMGPGLSVEGLRLTWLARPAN